MTLAPTADDLYLWAFLALRGYDLECGASKATNCWPNSQTNGTLWEINDRGGGNDLAIKDVFQECHSLANRISTI